MNLTEFITNPKNSISLTGAISGFLKLIPKDKFCNRKINVSLLANFLSTFGPLLVRRTKRLLFLP